MDSRKLILRNAMILAGGSAAARGLGLLSQVLMARWLGPEDFGLFSLSMSIFALFSVGALFGFQGSLPRLLPDHAVRGTGREGEVLSTAALLALGASLVLGLSALLTRESVIARFFGESKLGPCLLILALGFPVSVAADLLQAVARGLKHTSYRVIYGDIGLPLVRIVVFLGLAAVAVRLSEAAAFGVVAANGVAVAGIWLGLRKNREISLSKPTRAMAAEVVRFSWPLAFSGILFVLLSRTDVYGVGYFLGVEEVGIYAVAVTLAGLLNQVGLCFGYTLLPVLTEEYSRNRAEAERIGQETLRWVCLATLPLVGLTIINAEPIVAILFGAKYVAAAPVVSVLAVGIGLNVLSGPAGNLLVASGDTVRDMLSSCIPVVLNLILNVILVPRYGLLGAAAASSISLALKAVMAFIFSRLSTGLRLAGPRLLAEVALSAGLLGVAGIALMALGTMGNAWADLIRNTVLMGGSYLVFVKLLGGRSAQAAVSFHEPSSEP